MIDQRIGWHRTRLDPEALRELTTRNNLKGLLRVGSFLLIFCMTTLAAVWLFLRSMWVPVVVASYSAP